LKKSIIIEGQKLNYYESESKIDPLCLVTFLKAQKIYPKMYWNERFSNEERIAIGSILSLDHIPLSSEIDQETRLYGGYAFSQKTHPESIWGDFPKSYFFLPQYEIIQSREETRLITRSLKNETLDKLCWNETNLDEELLIKERSDLPSEPSWHPLIEKCLTKIDQKILSKVVLARQTTIESFRDIDPYAMLQTLKEKKLNTTIFSLQIQPPSTFIGSTPEKLYTKEGSSFYTEALAGTLPRGASEREDSDLQTHLLQSAKDLDEVAKVESFLKVLLHSFGEDVKHDVNYSIFQTPNVQHLYKKLSCTIGKNISHTELTSAIHPTPAVGGMPKEPALAFIEKYEPFDRGWYAAPIGWISGASADLAVAIRSALIVKDKVHLFAGTGIVKASDPKEEWQELESKISQYMELFYATK